MVGEGYLVLIGLFILRILVPVALTVGLGYLLLRLDKRWQEEAQKAREEVDEDLVDEQSNVPSREPAQPMEVPTGLSWGSSLPPRQPAFALQERAEKAVNIPPVLPALAEAPCWMIQNCDPAKRVKCAATQHPEMPCWLARLQDEGVLPASCPQCQLFNQAVARD